jgi:ATP-dependent helicase/nuclease subunit A
MIAKNETGDSSTVAAVRLTDEQEQAVVRRAEPLLLSAGAGSGKTSVLVERFVRAVLEDGVAAGRILAITFTERAAGELRERVRARFLALEEREAARDTEAAFVSTFHGFCARLLRAHALAAGLDPEFTILEEGLAIGLRERAFSSATSAFLADREDALDLLAAYGVDQLRTMVLGAYAELRSRGERFPRLPAAGVGTRPEDLEVEVDVEVEAEAAAACALLDELLRGFGEAYEALKRSRGAVDFDDLELRTRELLEQRASVRETWSRRFELLMVDEFQDTNPRQLAIVRALDRGNLFTVGDELQSIYGFRHADVGLFRARRAELAEREASLALTRNFRSRPALLEVVNAVFAERLGERFTPLVAGRDEAETQGTAGSPNGGGATRGAEPRVELLLSARSGWEESESSAREIARGLPPATIWRQAEARLLAQRVQELVGQGAVAAGEVVVLLRAVGDIEVYERALQLRGLRTLAMVGGFWGRMQTRELLAYLRVLANPLDELALYETLASPLVGVSSDGLALLAHAARVAGRGAWETTSRLLEELESGRDAHDSAARGAQEILARLSRADRDMLERFRVRLLDERSAAPRRSISRLIERAIDASGYREHVLSLEWGERRLANVHKLLRLARRFEASEGRDLRAFLDHLVRLADVSTATEPDAPVDGVEPDAVRLMTIHAAKGLEFPVVCVADLGRAVNTRMPRLLVEGERIGLSLLRLDGEKARPALEYEALCEERRRAQAEEEDRILYVAMTRARERLLLSGALELERSSEQRDAAPPIAWLAPALAGGLELSIDGGQPPVCDVVLDGGRAVSVRLRVSSPATVGTVLKLDADGFSSSADASRVGFEGVAEIGSEGVCSLGSPDVLAMGSESQPSAEEHSPLDSAEPVLGQLAIPGLDVEAVAHERTGSRHAAVEQGPPGDGITTLSYTSLSQLERCGYRYYLERTLGLPEDHGAARASGAGLEARARGTLVHRVLESLDFVRRAPPSSTELRAVERELGIRVGAAEREEISALIAGAIASPVAARVGAAELVRREHPFAFALNPGEPLLTGVIDLLAREADGGFVVLDYKSDRVGAEVDLVALVEREYDVQRLLYALAVLRGGAAHVEVLHWFLQRPGEPVAERFAAADRGELEERLAARIQRGRAQGFSVSARPHRGLCLTCPGRNGLCSWDEAQTLRETPEAPRS